ncbi:HutD family protein [Variovorax paradoxus]|nr:HutD family protein [Variovorax paradoxus]
MTRFDLAQLPATPWRNGGGWTREIGAGAFNLSVGEARADLKWDWRLSVASIATDGAFSTFPGVDRIAVLVDGAVTLSSATATLSWRMPGDAHAFAGEAQFMARLPAGPARFFNVMTRRANARAEAVVHRQGFRMATPIASQVCLLVLKGSFRVLTPSGEQRLDAEQGLICEARPEEAEIQMLSASGCIVQVQLFCKNR